VHFCLWFLKVTIDTWRLGWNFTAGESVQSGNIYTAGVDALSLNGSNVQLQSTSANNSVQPFSWTSISLLGTKSVAPTPNSPYKVSQHHAASPHD
jgi:hypothetical protein